MIIANNVSKQYRYFEKPEGFSASFKSLFHRTYQYKQALKPLSFTLEKGEFLGVMGPNGAGKSTLIKLLTGIVARSAGQLQVLGSDPFTAGQAYKKRIAVVMGQKSQLWWDLPAADTFLLQKTMYGIDDARFRQNVGELTELFDVGKLLHVPVRQLSLGERMKFELICALLHDPLLLYLDEPTLGLDAGAQIQIRKFLKEAGQQRGVSLLLTSHYVQDLIELCPRVLVLRSGEKIYDGELGSLLRAQSHHRLATLDLLAPLPAGIQPGWIVRQNPSQAVLRIPSAQVGGVLAELFSKGIIRDLRVEDEDVSQLVERIYESGGTPV